MINDQGYFKQFPAPVFEGSCQDHIDTIINHTTPYYGPLLYWLVRCCGARYVAEIGIFMGYTSYFLASGVKDNMTRLSGAGQYYGVDISGKCAELQKKLRDKNLPATMIQMDSYDMNNKSFPGTSKFGLVFIDGWHSTQHLYKEIDTLWPMLHDKGRGYMVIHDVYGWVMEPMQKILADPKYNKEVIRFPDNYGLAIIRKMDNYREDPSKTWPQGPQKDIRKEEDDKKKK